jgi:hypothetical protein
LSAGWENLSKLSVASTAASKTFGESSFIE